MKIQVTEQDIRSGMPRDERFCPIAKALRRKIAAIYGVRVHYSSVALMEYSDEECDFYEAKTLPLDFKARSFIAKFDNRDSVEPFEFELDIPEEYCVNTD